MRRLGLEQLGLRGSVWAPDRSRGAARAPIGLADLRALREGRDRSSEGACGCKHRLQAPRPRSRVLDSGWLVRALGDQLPGLVADDGPIDVDDAAWWAVQALLQHEGTVSARADRIFQRRAQIWGERPARMAAIVEPISPGRALGANACGCVTVLFCAARYVDRTNGDDRNTGGLEMVLDPTSGRYRMTAQPWKTLRRVEDWLADGVYGSLLASRDSTCLRRAYIFLKRGETWDGTEEQEEWDAYAAAGETPPVTYQTDWASLTAGDRGDQAALTLQDLKGVSRTADEARSGRVMLTSYGDPSLPLPIIDGMEGGEPQVGDARIGVLVLDCCYLAITDIEVRGFGTAIDVRGACADHLYSGLTLQDNAIVGLAIGVDERDVDWFVDSGEGGTDEDAWLAMALRGLYPDEIMVEDCTFTSNGYDTKGADLALNFLATNCTIRNNTMTGDDQRGVDGIVAQVPSSGHLIEGNTIGRHNKFCYTDNSDKAVIVRGTSYCSGGYTLLQGCADPGTSCLDDGLGYKELYYDPLTSLPAASIIAAGEDAFGEDGIDLKGLRNRTFTSEDETVIRDNLIFGHTVGKRAGINISDGTQNIHIYNNRIFLNARGILVTNQTNRHPAWTYADTSGIYIYRNLIYLNQEQGIAVKSDEDDYKITQVWMVNNTIAHNLLNGVLIANNTDAGTEETAPDVDYIYLYNNLIARNGMGVPYREDLTEGEGSLQVNWDGKIDLVSGSITFGSDYNCYLGWERPEDGSTEKVIRARAGTSSAFTWLTVAEAQDSATLGIETAGTQALTLGELYLADEGTISSDETLGGSTDIGDNFLAFYAGELASLASLDVTSSTGVHTWDYTPTSTSSLLVDAASTAIGSAEGIYHHDTSTVIPLGPDLAGVTSTASDIGALESVP